MCFDLWLMTLKGCKTGAHIKLAELILFLLPTRQCFIESDIKTQQFRGIVICKRPNAVWSFQTFICNYETKLQSLEKFYDNNKKQQLFPPFLCFAAFLRWPDGRLQQRIIQQFLRRPSIRAAHTGRQSFTFTYGHREQPRSAPPVFFPLLPKNTSCSCPHKSYSSVELV